MSRPEPRTNRLSSHGFLVRSVTQSGRFVGLSGRAALAFGGAAKTEPTAPGRSRAQRATNPHEHQRPGVRGRAEAAPGNPQAGAGKQLTEQHTKQTGCTGPDRAPVHPRTPPSGHPFSPHSGVGSPIRALSRSIICAANCTSSRPVQGCVARRALGCRFHRWHLSVFPFSSWCFPSSSSHHFVPRGVGF